MFVIGAIIAAKANAHPFTSHRTLVLGIGLALGVVIVALGIPLFLKKVRKYVDDNYPGRVLLAEANQWPADVVDYFGDPKVGGDECHMCFHFPLMPRIFMAARR